MTDFDQAKRDKTRRTLLNYMEHHGIGVPRLAKRISESTERDYKIPVKTLQRFLGGHIRTNDQYVGIFHQFAQMNEPPDPVINAGEALAAFYGDNVRRDYSGSFHATTQMGEASEVTISKEAGFWRVKEVTATGGRSVFDGVAVCSGEAAFFVLKDRLAGLPRTYTVWPQADDKLCGCGTTVNFVSFDPSAAMVPQTHPFEITLRR